MQYVSAALGLLLAVVLGVLAISSVSALQTTGSALGGGAGEFFDLSTTLWVILIGTVAIGALIAVTMLVLRR